MLLRIKVMDIPLNYACLPCCRFAKDQYLDETVLHGGDGIQFSQAWAADGKGWGVVCQEERRNSVRLQLWDIAGQDRFGAIARVFYKDAFGAILVYDLSRQSTFDAILKWKSEIDAKVLLPDGSPLPVVLVGNKCDLEKHEVDTTKLDAFCVEHGFITHFETSAKTNTNIDDCAATHLMPLKCHARCTNLEVIS